jgi:hypothetical protein
MMCGHEVRFKKKGRRIKKVSKQEAYENAVRRSRSLFKRANGNRRAKLITIDK